MKLTSQKQKSYSIHAHPPLSAGRATIGAFYRVQRICISAICRIRDCWQFALYLIRCVYKWNVLNESFLEYIYIYITFRYKCKNWKHSMRISRNFKYIFLMTQERVNWNKFRSEIKVEISRFFRNEQRNWEFFFTGLIVVIHRSIGTASRRDFSSYFLLSFSPFSTLRIGENGARG